MSFVKKAVNTTPIEDTVFAIVAKAAAAKQEYGKDQVIDATIGSLYDETGKLVAYQSVFTPYDAIEKERKAKYAGSFTGNHDYRRQVYEWLLHDHPLPLSHSVIATPGGTGAINLTLSQCLDAGECIVLPNIAWGSYQLMATMANLTVKTYSLFEGEHFHLESFKNTCREVISQQNKLVVVINDPCHNPTGYSLSDEEWQEVIAFLNECGKKVPVVLLNDIAYIDYAYDLERSRAYMEHFQTISDQVMIIVAFSCSKSLTSYGLRCGAAVILAKSPDAVREAEIVFEKAARALWSNIPNAAMDNFTYVTTENRSAFLAEKQKYIQLLKQRSELFMREAKAVELPCYPYKEGFFITVKVPDNDRRDRYHEALMKHLIFTVKVNQGIRVAICSLSLPHCQGLAKTMKEILDATV